jgi:hypothetical protein
MKTSGSAYMLGKVKEWKSSGLSAGEFAKRNGFSKSGFDYWVKKYHKLNGSKPVSFIELTTAENTAEAVNVITEPRKQAVHQGSIEITFPGGMCVKIYG